MAKVAVVTGAGTGVGRAIAVQLGREGWDVVLVGRTQRTLDETAALVGPKAWIHVTDISNNPGVSLLGAAVHEKYGDVQVLVNAAGNQRAAAEPAKC